MVSLFAQTFGMSYSALRHPDINLTGTRVEQTERSSLPSLEQLPTQQSGYACPLPGNAD